MAIDSAFQFLRLTLEVFFLDLLLSGDNAVVIALACRSLPTQERRQAMVAGTGIAIALRILLTLLVTFVLGVPALKLLGGIALTVIAVRLTLNDQGAEDDAQRPAHADLMAALGTVVVADLAMSTDNVVALAAIAQGNVWVLALGLMFSVPLLMFGSWYVTSLLTRYPALIPIGGALLGWLAGDIAVSDPLYADWIEHQSPALSVVVPLLTAAYVLVQSRIIDQSRASAALLRPAPVIAPLRQARPALAAAIAIPVAKAGEAVAQVPVEFKAPVTGRSRAAAVRSTRKFWLIAVGILAAIGAGYGLLNANWMPIPTGMIQYDCPTKGVSVSYLTGGSRIRIAAGGNSANGLVRPDNQIDWGDLHSTSTTLGFVPPTRVVYADAQTLRVTGGMFEDVTCHVR